jgi:hypothetical protein
LVWNSPFGLQSRLSHLSFLHLILQMEPSDSYFPGHGLHFSHLLFLLTIFCLWHPSSHHHLLESDLSFLIRGRSWLQFPPHQPPLQPSPFSRASPDGFTSKEVLFLPTAPRNRTIIFCLNEGL